MSETERVRVAVTVFAEVDADVMDAGHVVSHLIRQALPIGKKHEIVLRAGTWTVVVHDVMENGMAAGNGYLWTQPTSKAYTQYNWQNSGQEQADG